MLKKTFIILFFTILLSSCKIDVEYKETIQSLCLNNSYETFRQHYKCDMVIDENNVDFEFLSAAIFFETNYQRFKYGLKRYVYSHVLYQAAYEHSYDMVVEGFFDHTNPNDSSTPSDRIRHYGQWYGSCGENILNSFINTGYTYLEYAKRLVDLWMNSPGHKANILNANFKRLGVGCYKDSGNLHSTQVFANATND